MVSVYSLTNVDMLQIRQVQRRANHVGFALREDDMAAIVALVDRFQNILRVIRLHVIVTLDVAVPVPRWRLRDGVERLFRLVGDLWTSALMLRDVLRQERKVLFVGRPRRAGAEGLEQQSCQGGFKLHCRLFCCGRDEGAVPRTAMLGRLSGLYRRR